ncbi:MFS transporter [Rufibacter roseus]|uniref:MFS transporter n=2 Tax=Rufibacter roseus TaxID=1567108 RepID=A0ABW2DNV6_9BACT|nr:MFS transporter [Rufibacter roseus]
MTIGAGLVVANIYYNQPLLGDIARTFNTTEAKAGSIAMYTQVGYALGLLLLVPMGDMLQRKRLIMSDFAFIIGSLLLGAFSPNIYVLMGASLLIGISSVIPQLFIPLAAHLAKPEERGKVVGTVLSGLLIGILLSRTLSGFVGAHLGWRAMFLIAAGLMALLWIALLRLLPEVHPDYKGTYRSLMASLWPLFRQEPLLRLSSIRGGLLFGSFSAFWSTLVFHLEAPPFNAGSDVAGAFGLIGAVGAFAAPVVGRLSDKVNTKNLVTAMISLVVFSFVLYGVFSTSMFWLIAGVILMDLGLQAAHTSNQTTIFALNPQARNRLNTVYMFTYFVGGALGTFLASHAWVRWQWMGVVATGLLLSSLSLLVHLFFSRKKKNVS